MHKKAVHVQSLIHKNSISNDSAVMKNINSHIYLDQIDKFELAYFLQLFVKHPFLCTFWYGKSRET